MSGRRIFITVFSVALVVLGVFGFFQARANAQARAAYALAYPTGADGQTYGYGGYGMMGGYGSSYVPTSGGAYGPGYGMMGGYGRGYANANGSGYGPGYGYGYGMMGAYGYGGQNLPAGTKTIDANQAAQAVGKYLSGLGNTGKDLVVAGAPVEYNGSYSFLVNEKSTGHAAFNVVVDKVSGLAAREMGLAMYWDVKYGVGCGLLNDGDETGATAPQTPASAMTVSATAAAKAAVSFLGAQQGNTLAIQGSPVTFYGYYQFQTAGGGKAGPAVLVNGYTGQAGFSWLGAPK